MRWGASGLNSRILGGVLLSLGVALIIFSLPGWFWTAVCGVALALWGWSVISG
ncbi:MAG: hypothetical protein ACYC41_05065 [Bacillota bacterium]